MASVASGEKNPISQKKSREPVVRIDCLRNALLFSVAGHQCGDGIAAENKTRSLITKLRVNFLFDLSLARHSEEWLCISVSVCSGVY